MKTILILIMMLVIVPARAQKIPMDKVAHFTIGASLYGFGYCMTYKFTQRRWISTGVGMGLAVMAAAGKEWYDYRHFNSPRRESLLDFSSSVMGAACAAVTIQWTFGGGNGRTKRK